MKQLLLLTLVASLVAGSVGVANAQMDFERVGRTVAQFPFAIDVGTPGEEGYRFLYADVLTHIHVYRQSKGRFVLDWESTNLGSRVTSLFVSDLYGDGKLKLAVSTAAGRMLIYDLENYDLEWESLEYSFDRVACMVSSNVDRDVQHELIFIADGFLYFVDSLNKSIEWQSQSKFEAKHIVIANVDDDEQSEIILNTGAILDSRFYDLEFQADTPFGERMSLVDLNGDGFPEIIGEQLDFNLKVFDVYAQREIW